MKNPSNKKDPDNKLGIIILVCMIIFIGLAKLVTSGFFNFSKQTEVIIAIIGLILFLIVFIAMNFFTDIGLLIFGFVFTILCILSLTATLRSHFFENNSKQFWIYFFLCLLAFISLLINNFNITQKLLFQKEPEPSQIKNTSMLSKILNLIDRFICLIEKNFFKIRFLFPIISYIIIIFLVVFFYTIVYEGYNNYANEKNINEGLFYSQPIIYKQMNNIEFNKNRVEGWDLLYFSSVTFFTVGYGDILPKGNTLKIIVQSEMILGHFLTALYIPLILYSIYKFFDSKTQHYLIETKNYKFNVKITECIPENKKQ